LRPEVVIRVIANFEPAQQKPTHEERSGNAQNACDPDKAGEWFFKVELFETSVFFSLMYWLIK
jgi:hypothetical protein